MATPPKKTAASKPKASPYQKSSTKSSTLKAKLSKAKGKAMDKNYLGIK
jgi:hypothetical protein